MLDDSFDKDLVDKVGGRTKVSEFKEGNVVVEVWEKKDVVNGRTFFDVRHMREFTFRETGERRRGSFIQQRDIRQDLIATIRAMEYISERHRELRDAVDYPDVD